MLHNVQTVGNYLIIYTNTSKIIFMPVLHLSERIWLLILYRTCMRLNDLYKLVIVDKDLVSGIFLTFLFSFNSILYPRMIEGGIRERQNEIQQNQNAPPEQARYSYW